MKSPQLRGLFGSRLTFGVSATNVYLPRTQCKFTTKYPIVCKVRVQSHFKSGVNRFSDAGEFYIRAIRAVGVPKLRLEFGLMDNPESIRVRWDSVKSS